MRRIGLVGVALLVAAAVGIGWFVLAPSDAVVAENRDPAPIVVAAEGTMADGARAAGVVTVMPGGRVTLVGENGVSGLSRLSTIEVLDTSCSRIALLDVSQVGEGGAVVRVEDRAATLTVGSNPRPGDQAHPEATCEPVR